MSWVEETEYLHPEEQSDVFTPKLIGTILISYLIVVYQIGPRFMKNRPAYKLKKFISFYNIFQVLYCVYLINRIWNLTSWSIFELKECVAYLPNTPQRTSFEDISYKIFLLKIIELVDTILFVLRKKTSQITYLHVFHHSSIITLCYLILKYAKFNVALFPIYLNSYVHVVMYSYYFFANICSRETMQKFIYIKKSITIIQMVQFCLILLQAGLMWSACKVPPVIKYYYCVVIGVIFYGFYDFYKKAYLSKQEKIDKTNSK